MTNIVEGAAVAGAIPSSPAGPTNEEYELARTKRFGLGAKLAAVWLVAALLYAIVVPLLLHTGTSGALANKGFLKDMQHPLGADSNGNDLTVRVAEGLRNSLLLATCAIAIGLLLGGSLGLIAGYFGGRIDAVLTMFFNVLLAIPAFILAVALVAALGNDKINKDGNPVVQSFGSRLTLLIIALGLVSLPVLARITRANTLQWSQREFVMAARAQGAGHVRIMVREVLPNVAPAMFSIALLGIAVTIVAEGALSVLGSGIKGGSSLGNIISAGRDDLQNNPHIVFEPIVFLFLTVLSLNYLGDIIRARFDVRESVL